MEKLYLEEMDLEAYIDNNGNLMVDIRAEDDDIGDDITYEDIWKAIFEE